MTIKKIFSGIYDDEVHSDFLKFGRGEYKDRYLLEGKRQANKWAIKTGPEYVNYLVRKCLEKISGEVSVGGIIVSTTDLRNEFNFEIVKAGNFQGIRKFQIDTIINPSEILALMEKYPRAFYALSFKGEDFVLKVKAKAPKSAKPGKENEDGPKAEFCSLKTNDKELVDELFFDFHDFKEIKINHSIKVEDIVYPDNIDRLKPTEIREQSKRKGVVIRQVTVDGVEKVSESEFVA
ncbi:MAG: hypothetical protein ABIF88_00600 [archaeon]